MPDLSTVLSPPNYSAWAYDPSRNVIDIATHDGDVYAYNLATQALTLLAHVGGNLGSAAISPDGHYLVVGDYDRILTSSPFAVTPTYQDQLTRIDLTTLAQTQINYTIPSSELGVRDIAITASGSILVSGQYNGSGWTPLRSFDINNPAAGPTTINGFVINTISDDSQLIASPSGKYVLVELGNSTPSQSFLYSDTAHAVVGQDDPWALHTGAQWGGGDISEAKGLVVDVMEYGVYVFDLTLHPVANLTSYGTADGAIAGAVFSPEGDKLYLWQGAQAHIIVLDTATWNEIGTVEVSSTIADPTFFSPYKMGLADNGRVLMLDTGAQIEMVDLSARLNTQLTPENISVVGAVTLTGGAGDDTLSVQLGSNELHGGYGNDVLNGGVGFDYLIGNQGNDSQHGADGNDWVVGGKGADSLTGDAGDDIVYGNIGNDTLDGGIGADLVRGGQGDDSITGGAGDDWLSGDRGNDTLVGGAGADTFHTFAGAGADRVLDFNAAEGDRVQLDAGTIYTVSQVGLDTVISLGGQGQIVLVGVQAASLPTGWIFTL